MTTPEPTSSLHQASGSASLVHAERAALATDLADLTGHQWATLSLCTEFTVRQVLAHLTAGASLNPVRWLAGVIRCRFDFDRQVAMRLAEQLGATPAETLTRFRRAVTSTTKPPLPVWRCSAKRSCTPRTSAVRWESTAPTRLPPSPGRPSYYQGSDLVVPAKGRIAGLRLRCQRRPFHRWLRPVGIRHHPGPDHGHDRPRHLLRRTRRRRRSKPPSGTLSQAVTSTEARPEQRPRQRTPGRPRRPGQAGARSWPELEDDVDRGLGDLPEPAEAGVAGQLPYRCRAGLGAERDPAGLGQGGRRALERGRRVVERGQRTGQVRCVIVGRVRFHDQDGAVGGEGLAGVGQRGGRVAEVVEGVQQADQVEAVGRVAGRVERLEPDAAAEACPAGLLPGDRMDRSWKS